VISDYLDSLSSALSFDRSLSRSVRQEVEDHLWEAVAADQAGNGLEAERRATARFGDPLVLATEFALVALRSQAQKAAAAIILVVFGVFIAMNARVAWYTAMQWTMSDDMRALSRVVLSIDRYAFWLAVVLGIAGFIYITSRRARPAFFSVVHKQLRRFSFLCIAAASALVVSVISDGLLTALQLYGVQLCFDSLIPILLMAIEIAGAGVLTFQIRRIARRTTCMTALLKT
jgi:hypothetical protein